MDAVADVLQPYKEIVGYIVTLVTVARLLAGSLICWDIYKQRSTKFITITSFLLSLCLVSLNLKYGFILHDSTIVRVSTISIFVNTIYCLIYLYFSHEKLKVTRQISLAGALTTALIAYAQREDPYLVKNRLGVIITIFYLTVIASPLLGLKNVLQNQSTEGLPFPYIASGVAISSIWMVYGTILRDRITVCLLVIFERANVTFCNEKYLTNMSINVRRYSRRSSYVLNIYGTTLHQWTNNVTVDLIFNQFLHNEYRRSFVEFHYKFCDLINNEPYVGGMLKLGGMVCPMEPGDQRLTNLTVPANNFPNVFPFEKGRVDATFSITATKESILEVYVETTFKQ